MSTKEPSRFRVLEKNMTIAVAVEGAAFLLFLIAAGLGITWLKVMMVIAVVLISGLGFLSLYLTGELFRLRSRWIAMSFGAFLLCMLFSLILRFPSPSPKVPDPATAAAVIQSFLC